MTQTFWIKFQVDFGKVLLLAFGWAFGMLLMTLHEYSLLGDNGHYPNGMAYNFSEAIWLTPTIAFIAGLFLGSFEIFYLFPRMKRKSFGYNLRFKAIFYFILLYIIIGAGVHIYNCILLSTSLFDVEAVNGTRLFLASPFSLIIVLIWSATFILMLFILQVSDKFGQGVLKDFILGKYHHPKIEKRIFMFLDMKSSTTIAEKLGHIQYFQLLNDFFKDLTDPIVAHKGKIYQYVGDEVVVFWEMESGVQDANCINCFFAVEDQIKNLSSYYMETYGLVPEFKAGLYFGEVTTGEIGIIKKEIIFTGDVLNTTARIQGMCNSTSSKLLVSKELIELIPMKKSGFTYAEIGNVELRGRKSRIELVRVTKNTFREKKMMSSNYE
ncbi:MAG: adenylate/guanylate cyclase domain-containing protein [Bacteroidota bacterium]